MKKLVLGIVALCIALNVAFAGMLTNNSFEGTYTTSWWDGFWQRFSFGLIGDFPFESAYVIDSPYIKTSRPFMEIFVVDLLPFLVWALIIYLTIKFFTKKNNTK